MILYMLVSQKELKNREKKGFVSALGIIFVYIHAK